MTIELTPYEKNDLVRMLDYTVQKKQEDYKQNKITQIDYKDFLDKLFTIRQRINGIKPQIRVGQKSLLSDLMEE